MHSHVVKPSVLAAANTHEPMELDTMTVYGETYRNTATKTALEPGETPQSISVLDQQALEMHDADSVATALRYVPGVNTELRGGVIGRLDLFSIRGFINYQNYYDGLQLLYNDWNLQPQIDLKAVQQVEVFRGPTSTLYGSMPPGGMVNLIGKQPSTESFKKIEVAGGSRNLVEASVESRGQLGDSNLSYSLVDIALRCNLGQVSQELRECRPSRRLMVWVIPSINTNRFRPRSVCATMVNPWVDGDSPGTVLARMSLRLPPSFACSSTVSRSTTVTAPGLTSSESSPRVAVTSRGARV